MQPPEPENAYTFFGIRPGASSGAIHAAFERKLSQANGLDEAAVINTWYKLINTTAARLSYDAVLLRASATAGSQKASPKPLSKTEPKPSLKTMPGNKDSKTAPVSKPSTNGEQTFVKSEHTSDPFVDSPGTTRKDQPSNPLSLFARLKNKVSGAGWTTAASTQRASRKHPARMLSFTNTATASSATVSSDTQRHNPAGRLPRFLPTLRPWSLCLSRCRLGVRHIVTAASGLPHAIRHGWKPLLTDLARHLRRGRLPRWAQILLAIAVVPVLLLLLVSLATSIFWPCSSSGRQLFPPAQPADLRLDLTHYGVLGLDTKDATATQIRAAYLRAVLAHHPDRAKSSARADTHMHTITLAYEILKDPYQRCMYDLDLAGQWRARPSLACLRMKPWQRPGLADSKARKRQAWEKEQAFKKNQKEREARRQKEEKAMAAFFAKPPPPPTPPAAAFQNVQMVVYQSASSLLYRMIRIQLRVQFAIVNNFRRVMDGVHSVESRVRKLAGMK